MKIRHERPMSDLSFEVRAPLGLELVTGEVVTIANWSLKGFEFPGETDVLPKEATLSIPFQGVDIRFPVRLTSEPGSNFLSFAGLSGRQRETLAVFYRSILSGKMASTEDVITSLDTPVDLVPMEETEEEKEKATVGKSPRSLRAFFSVLLYLTIGGLVFWTLGSGIYSKISTVNIHNARIEAPLTTLTAGQSGFVERVLAAPGDVVSAGDILVRVATPDGEAALAEVRGRINLIEDRMSDAETRASGLATRIEQAYERLLAQFNTSPRTRIELVRPEVLAFEGRYSADHIDLFTAHDSVLNEIDSLDEELRRLRRERGRLRDAADALHIMAPEDGIVTEIAVLREQFVGRGTIVAQIEGYAARQARGWVNQDMAAAFYEGMSVTVTVSSPDGEQQMIGSISGLEAGIDPEVSPEFGILVSVTFDELDADETRIRFPHLMPVELRALRPWAANLAQHRDNAFGQTEG